MKQSLFLILSTILTLLSSAEVHKEYYIWKAGAQIAYESVYVPKDDLKFPYRIYVFVNSNTTIEDSKQNVKYDFLITKRRIGEVTQMNFESGEYFRNVKFDKESATVTINKEKYRFAWKLEVNKCVAGMIYKGTFLEACNFDYNTPTWSFNKDDFQAAESEKITLK